MLSKQELENMSNWQFNTPTMSELKELTEIYIDTDLPIEERFQSFLKQIGNPYCFLVNGKRVRITYDNNKKTLEQSLNNYITKKIDADNSAFMVEYKP